MKLRKNSFGKIVLITVFLIGSLVCLNAQEFAGGQGTEEDPWQIETVEQLNNVRNYLGEEHSDKYFIQTANIDLYDATREDGAYWNEGEGWMPIGERFNEFHGNYDGADFVMDSMYINRPETNDQGLFGYTESANIKNLGITNVDIAGRHRVGVFMGYAEKSTISNSYSTGSVTGDHDVGGLVGRAVDNNTISNSYSTGSVTGEGSGAGGLVGHALESTISNSYSTGSVTGDHDVGGLVGVVVVSTISNCYSTGSVTGEARIGGLAGEAGHSTISNSYWDMQTSGMDTSDGGEGRTTDEMTYPYSDNTYVEWDFDDVWTANVSSNANNGYPFLLWQISPVPQTASNPKPENKADGISVMFGELSWEYIENELYANPAGFRVYCNTTGEFGEDDVYDWVDYVEEQTNYISTDILPEELLPCTDYYWMVVPSNDAGDAEHVPVWTFRTGRYPNPAIAKNPNPEDDKTGVSVELDKLRWDYVVDTLFVNPEGFRVYFGTEPDNLPQHGSFIKYKDGSKSYSLSRSHAPHLLHNNTYYWKVVPTTKEEGEGEGIDAEDVPVWSFKTEEDTSVETAEPKLITQLNGNYPNPFNPDTTIEFNIKEETDATLSIYNIKGQRVRTLHSGIIKTGEHKVIWDGKDKSGKDAGSGVYFYRLKTNNYDQVNKMLLAK